MQNLFTPIKPKRISQEIVEQLKNLIFNGKLKPGQTLPAERELAKSLNVSRVSLREALNTLQEMGLLEIQQGNRTFVRPITTRSIYDPLVSFTKSSTLNFLRVFEIRKYLEIGSAALAAERATSEQIKGLKKILKTMESDLKKNRLGAKADLDFHTMIVEATHNQAYIHTLSTIYDLLQEEMRLAYGDIFKKRHKREKLLYQHKNIFRAIEEHNSEKAREEALLHLNFAEENFRDSLRTKT